MIVLRILIISLQQKISCKVRDEYSCLQNVQLPSEATNRVRNIPTSRSATAGNQFSSKLNNDF